MNSSRKIGVGIALIVVFSALLLSVWYFRPQPVQVEVLLSELITKENLLYRIGKDRPFTGVMIELYPGGARKSRSEILAGRLHGVSEGWTEGGLLEIRELFKDGVSHGLRTKWHSNGQKLSEATIVNGKIQGSFTRWHENGTIAEHMEMRDGQADGICTAWHPDGSLKAEATLRNGKVIRQKFWDSSEPQPAQSRVDS